MNTTKGMNEVFTTLIQGNGPVVLEVKAASELKQIYWRMLNSIQGKKPYLGALKAVRKSLMDSI